jgi:hypothetical protein
VPIDQDIGKGSDSLRSKAYGGGRGINTESGSKILRCLSKHPFKARSSQLLSAAGAAQRLRRFGWSRTYGGAECGRPPLHSERLSKTDCRPKGLAASSAGAFRKLTLPCPRVGDDGLQIVKARLPSECGTNSVAGGHD